MSSYENFTNENQNSKEINMYSIISINNGNMDI